MRDPLDELENFATPGLTMNPLPAAEVRRRGTRLRRRNNALAAIGGVAAVAIIATPLAVAATHDRTDTTPPPANPSPSVTWVKEIPADFPLADGLPTPVRTDASYEAQVTDICAGWAPPAASEVRQAVFKESEGGSSHTLALYPNEREAELGLTSLGAQTQACAILTQGKTRWVEVLPSGQGDQGDQSLVYVNHYSDASDIDVVQLVRVGNAILQATRYSNGVPAQDTADQTVDGSAAVVDAMCVFAADPC